MHFQNLTKCETQVLSLLPQGHTNKAIATKLGIKEHTVETHLDRIYRKLQITQMRGTFGVYQPRMIVIV